MLDAKFFEAVKRFEGFQPTAKWDYKQWTNGFGTKALAPYEHISETEANRRLDVELGKAMAQVEKIAPGAPQGVKDALCSLTFNSGTEWEHDKLGAAVKAGDWANAKAHFLMYDHAGGKVLNDLELRRAEEASWFPKAEPAVAPVAAAPAVQPLPEASVDPNGPAAPWTPGTKDPTEEVPAQSMFRRALKAIEDTL